MNSNSTLPIGYKLKCFSIKEVLGRGGFGVTYLAHDENLDLEVAIKEFFLHGFTSRSDDYSIFPKGKDADVMFAWGLERFVTEANTIRLFKHPNIVKIQSIIRDNNTAYIVMKYEHGKALDKLIREKQKFSEAELCDIIFPLLDALEVMHNQGFIHRDIKPGNIFIRNDSKPVLVDFGSARFTLDDDKTLTQLATPGYTPYEQYHGKSDTQGPWTDIYSLGATLYQMITGNKPEDSNFRAGASSEKNFNDIWDELEKYKGEYSIFFLRAIEHALRNNIEERPQTVSEWRAIITDPDVSTQTQWLLANRKKSDTPSVENKINSKWSAPTIYIALIILMITISIFIYILV